VNAKQNYMIRACALVLAVGGLAGIASAIYLGYKAAGQNLIVVVLTALFVFVYGWTSWIGIRLWRGGAGRRVWAQILFAAQIPMITVPGFTYEYYAGVLLGIVVWPPPNNVKLGIGANLKLFFDTTINEWAFGINLFAVLAFVFLLKVRAGQEAPPVSRN
jgi:hypothetical protein